MQCCLAVLDRNSLRMSRRLPTVDFLVIRRATGRNFLLLAMVGDCLGVVLSRRLLDLTLALTRYAVLYAFPTRRLFRSEPTLAHRGFSGDPTSDRPQLFAVGNGRRLSWGCFEPPFARFDPGADEICSAVWLCSTEIPYV